VKKLKRKTFESPKGIQSALFGYETIRLWLATIIIVYLINTFFFTGYGTRFSKRAKSNGYASKGELIGGMSTVQDTVFIQNAETIAYDLYHGFYGNENGLDHGILYSTNGK